MEERKGLNLTLICGSHMYIAHSISLRLVFYSIATAAQLTVSHGIMIRFSDQQPRVFRNKELRQTGQAELQPFPHVAALKRRLEKGLAVDVPARLKSGGFRGNQGDNRSVIHVGGSVGGPSLQR